VAAVAATAVSTRTTCQFQNRSGARLPNSPKFKWNVGATANFPLMSEAEGTFIVNYQHQSDVNFDLLGNPLLVQKAYGVLNASFGVEIENFKVTAFVNNLFNKHYASSLADGFGTYGGSATNDTHPISQFLTRDSQRYGGMKFTVTF
jgi:iron complex outermembrane receptor protein